MKGNDVNLLIIVHRSVVQMVACEPANSSMECGTINFGPCDKFCLETLKYFMVKWAIMPIMRKYGKKTSVVCALNCMLGIVVEERTAVYIQPRKETRFLR